MLNYTDKMDFDINFDIRNRRGDLRDIKAYLRERKKQTRGDPGLKWEAVQYIKQYSGEIRVQKVM